MGQDLINRTEVCPKNARFLTVTALVFVGALIVGWIVYECFGHVVIKAIYDGKGPETLRNLIQYQQKYPVEHYQQVGDGVFFRLTLMVSMGFGLVVVLYRLVFSESRLRPIWVILVCMSLVATIYTLNPYFRVYSVHGFFRGSIVYQILNGCVPPMDPLFAGEPLRSPWGFPWLAAQISYVLNVTPFTAFALINVMSLGLVMLLAYKISQMVVRDEKANIFSSVVAVFGTTIFSRTTIYLLLGLLHSSWAESRAIPALMKFPNANGAPLGMVCFLAFVFSVMKLFETRGSLRWMFAVPVSVMCCGFFYPPMVPAIPACVLAICASQLVLRGRRPDGGAVRASVLMVLASVAALAVLVPYSLSVSSGVSSGIELFRPCYFFRNLVNYLVPMLPLLAVILISSKYLFQRANQVMLTLVASVIAATMGCFLLVHVPGDVEYKFLILSALMLGVLGGVAIYDLRHRMKRIFVLLVLCLFLWPSCVEIAEKLNRLGNPVIFFYKKKAGFVETGRDIALVKKEEQQLYAWIRGHTSTEAVFIDSDMRIPIFGQRRLLIGIDLPDGKARTGYGVTMDKLRLRHGYDAADFERRRRLVKNVYGHDNVMTKEEILKSLSGKDIYIVSRGRSLRSDLYDHEFEEVFRSSSGNFVVVRPHVDAK